MPRYYRRRRTVVVKPKKKWASNFKYGTLYSSASGDMSPFFVMVENSVGAATPTPVIIKAGNFKVQGDMVLNYNSGSNVIPRITLVVFFLPEGVTLDAGTAAVVITNHPEWVMAWKQLDAGITQSSPGAVNTSAFSISSRLKRNLNSGDRICIGYINDNTAYVPVIKFSCQYWTCAN